MYIKPDNDELGRGMPRQELTREQLAHIEQQSIQNYRLSHPGSCGKQRDAACADVRLLIASHLALLDAQHNEEHNIRAPQALTRAEFIADLNKSIEESKPMRCFDMSGLLAHDLALRHRCEALEVALKEIAKAAVGDVDKVKCLMRLDGIREYALAAVPPAKGDEDGV